MLKKLLSNLLMSLNISPAATAQQREGHLLRENEIGKVFKSPVLPTGTLTSADSKSKGKKIKPL
jgi:hypothetical protein